MNGKTGRVVVACCALCAALGLIAFLMVRTGGVKAAPQALADVGKFRVGATLGEERASFSGRAKLTVFAGAGDPGWSTLQACLSNPALEAELSVFTPVLIDEGVDLATEDVLRERDGLRVVVRALNGKFLGGLPVGFRCEEVVELLRMIRANTTLGVSPVRESLPEKAMKVVEKLPPRLRRQRPPEGRPYVRGFYRGALVTLERRRRRLRGDASRRASLP